MRRIFRLSIFGLLIVFATQIAIGQISVGATLFEGGMKAFTEGRYGEAERLFRLVIVEVEKEAKEGNPLAPGLMSDTLNALAGALHGQGKFAEAEKILQEQIQLLEKARIKSDSDYSQTSAALNNLGLLYNEQKKYKEAEETHRRAIRLREKHDPPPRRNLAVSFVNLGKVFYDQGKSLEAEPFFREARAILFAIGESDATDEDVDTLLMISNNLALIAAERGEFKEAEYRYKEVISITEARKGRYHPDLIQYLNNYAKLLRQTKRVVAAKKIEIRAAAIEKRN
ncbi:MAG: tetratricopeptide repeat protein [Acidobacteria bacterium]|nr:tetratricopeptide repeat protein [Acidobacteriota bacterium]